MGYSCRHRRSGFLILIGTAALLMSSNVSAQVSIPPVAASAQPPAARPPVQNRANEVLPAWIRVRAEFRERMERADAIGYVADRRDTFWLSRLRLNTTVTAARLLSFQVQLQDARVADKDIGAGGSPFSAPIDVRTAFADIGSTTTPLSVRVGRQELVFGEQRLVGHVSWLNAARSFDAARLTIRRPGLRIDAFAASVVRILTDDWDESGNGNRFHGVHASATNLVPRATVEPYLFWRKDTNQRSEAGETASLQVTTAGIRWAGQFSSAWEYGAETAFQTGSLGSDDIGAWALHAKARTPAFGPALRWSSEYNHASGDDDPTDGQRGTFDPLYPTAHDKYGLADQVGWRNIHHVRTGVDIGTIRGLPLTLNYHSWWLASARDGLYLPSGASSARVPGGAAGRHVGQEFDVQGSRSVTPHLQLAAGYSYIRPGRFLKEATPGSSFNSVFLMATYVFLADR